jgi:hypothetical protein
LYKVYFKNSPEEYEYFAGVIIKHVARMGEEWKVTEFSWESQKERDHFEDQSVDTRMGSECILKRLAGGL